jgi:peptide/nickel transport system substrate-binding protein
MILSIKPKLLAVGTLLTVSSLALTGCFSGSSADSAGSDTRLRAVMFLPPRAANNPFTDDAFKLTRLSVTESLTRLGDDGKVEPALATEWKQEDPTTWRFTIRSGVKFHDGTDMTPDSVVTALQAAQAAKPKPRVLDGTAMTLSVDGDDVVIKTEKENPLLVQVLASPQLPILAASAYKDGKADVTKAATGLFVQVALNGTSTAVYDRNEDYWGEEAKVSGIDVSYVPDGAARAAALRTDSADIVEQIPNSQASILDPALLHSIPTTRTALLYLNPKSPTFKDPGLRAAARQAIDKDKIVQSVYEGNADAATGMLGLAVPWAAKMRESVHRTETPATTPNQQTIKLATYTDAPELPEIAVHLEQSWEAAGFTVEQVVREYSSMEADVLAGAFDAFIQGRNTALDTGDPVAYMSSDYTCGGSYNLAQLCDPAVDEAVAKASVIPPGEARQKAIVEAEAKILSTDAVIALVYERYIQGESSRVSGAIRDSFQRRIVTADTTLSGN